MFKKLKSGRISGVEEQDTRGVGDGLVMIWRSLRGYMRLPFVSSER